MSRWVLLGICVLFGTYLVLRLLPRGGGRRGAARAIAAARARAAAAPTGEARAEALADAMVAAATARRWTSAAGLALRALRAHPEGTLVPERLVAALGKARPRLVESILWRRLAALPDDAAHRPAAVALTTSLADLYERRLRDRVRAVVLRRHAASLSRDARA
jgi:hypothetical protein